MSSTSEAPGIVVVGTPRSGTTLLRRILDAHSRICCPPETYLLSAAARFLHEESFAAGLRIGVLSGLAFAGFEEDEVLGRLRSFVLGFLQEHAEAQGKPRWAEKTAFDAFHLDAIRRVVGGHVRFVCIQRHGLDVACSLRDLVAKTGGYVQELHRYLQREPEPLVALCRALHIPTRLVCGHWSLGNRGQHVWTEFYLPNYGWIPSDPSEADYDNPEIITDTLYKRYFGHLDNTSIVISKGMNIALWPYLRGKWLNDFGLSADGNSQMMQIVDYTLEGVDAFASYRYNWTFWE